VKLRQLADVAIKLAASGIALTVMVAAAVHQAKRMLRRPRPSKSGSAGSPGPDVKAESAARPVVGQHLN
jgi:hypothetical protein